MSFQIVELSSQSYTEDINSPFRLVITVERSSLAAIVKFLSGTGKCLPSEIVVAKEVRSKNGEGRWVSMISVKLADKMVMSAADPSSNLLCQVGVNQIIVLDP